MRFEDRTTCLISSALTADPDGRLPFAGACRGVRFYPDKVKGEGVLDDQPQAGVLTHCTAGRRRSAMLAYAVLRLRGQR